MSANAPDLPETPPEAVATPAPTPTPEPTGPGQAWDLAEEAPRANVIEVAGGSKEALAQQGETLNAIVKALDSQAITLGSLRISAFDVLFVIGTIALVITVAWFATRVARRAMRNVSRFDGAQSLLAEKLATIAIWTLAFFVTVDLIGIDLSALAFFGGAFGLAVGFGFQKTFGNLISGILLLLDKSIKPGDVIELGPTFGWIQSLGSRYVSVVTRDGKEFLIPNEDLITQQVVNWSYSNELVRMEATFAASTATRRTWCGSLP